MKENICFFDMILSLQFIYEKQFRTFLKIGEKKSRKEDVSFRLICFVLFELQTSGEIMFPYITEHFFSLSQAYFLKRKHFSSVFSISS